MKSKSPCIAWCALIAGSLFTFWSNARPQSYFMQMLRRDASTAVVKFAHQFDEVDANAKKLAPRVGNLALGFRGYDAANTTDANFAARMYFRSNYVLYPQRVYPSVPDETLINSGDDILSASAAPSRDWARMRDVHTIAVFSVLPNGESFVQPITVAAP